MTIDKMDDANRLFFSIQDCDDWAKRVMMFPIDDYKLKEEFINVLERIRLEMQKEFDKL